MSKTAKVPQFDDCPHNNRIIIERTENAIHGEGWHINLCLFHGQTEFRRWDIYAPSQTMAIEILRMLTRSGKRHED